MLEKIFCFQHCTVTKNVFCLKLPQVCPVCKSKLFGCLFIVPPFGVPSPFRYHPTTALRENHGNLIDSCSILVRPTSGTFLQNYTSGANLHIGLTDSKGAVYSYDENGVSHETSGWDGSLSIPLFDSLNGGYIMQPLLREKWDSTLQLSVDSLDWNPDRYDEVDYNCYDYIIRILRDVIDVPLNKETFTSTYVLPETKQAAKYIQLYRDICSSGGSIVLDASVT